MTDDSVRFVPRRRVLIWALVAVLLVGVPAALWWRGSQTTGQVSVSTGVATCDDPDTATRIESDGEGEGFVQDAISMDEGFRCTVTVRVSNDSSREVDLDRFVVPVSGPGGGGGMRVTRIASREVPADGEVDATVQLDQPLAAGSVAYLDLDVRFRASGCASPGGWMSLTPTIDVSHLATTRRVPVADLPLFLGTADTSCDT